MSFINTSYDTVINAFLRRIEKDREFFAYLNVGMSMSQEIAIERATTFMHEAAARIAIDGMPSVDFMAYDDETEEFGFELTRKEVFLLASLMFESYLGRDIAKLKCLSVNYTPTDVRVFAPSNARKTFQTMYEFVCAQNIMLLDTYRNTDRLTGEYVGINYASYDEE